jgi:hypothetical protein
MSVHTHKTRAHTHTYSGWFLVLVENCSMDNCQYLCIDFKISFIPGPLHMVLDVWFNMYVADLV